MKTDSIFGKLMALAVEVNEKTEKAIFVSLRGHVRYIEVEITEGKFDGRYSNVEQHFHISLDDREEEALSAITFLQALLPEPTDCKHGIDLEPGVDLVHRQGGPVEPTEYQFGRHPYDSHGIEY